MLEIVTMVLGPVQTNAYLVGDPESKEAVVIDPAWDGEVILKEAAEHGWQIKQVWITHAHFDHIAGVGAVVQGSEPAPGVAVHPNDDFLWQMQGGAPWFGIQIDPLPAPTAALAHGQVLRLGQVEFEVRHAPGHTPGHVIFYSPMEGLAFCGDVIFQGGIGRTDLPRGDYEVLLNSIREQVFTLPEGTRLLSGHGLQTTVGEERVENPFVE